MMKRNNSIAWLSGLLTLVLAPTHAVSAAGGSSAGATAQQTGARENPTVSIEETISLNPFEVVADKGDTYDATNTNSVTGTNLSLNNTPLDAKIFNRTMMDELGIVDISTMLMEFGGLGAPLLAAGSENQGGMLPGDGVDYKTMTSRGLTISNPRRDGFLRSETSMMDSFDVERVEALQGSNSLLFGSGDAGGVVNISSKRARLNQRSLRLSANGDSEGTTRYTADMNVGRGLFAVRFNAVKDETHYFRPVLEQKGHGVQLAATFRPFKRLTISGDYRNYSRDHIRPSPVTVRAPTNLLLTNGARLDNQSSRYLTAFGGSELLDNFITITNSESATGAFTRHTYDNTSKTITVEASATDNLSFQFRYGHDARRNRGMSASSAVIFHPDASGNLMADASGNLLHQWAINSGINSSPLVTGAHGSKATVAYQKDLGRWGRHQMVGFYSNQESWNNSESWRFYEVDSAGTVIQNLAQVLEANGGRNLMPAAWMPAFPTSPYGNPWPTEIIRHPNGKTYRFLRQIYPGAVTPTAGNPSGLSGPINATTGQSTVTGYSHADTSEKSTGVSAYSALWGGRINTMAGFRFETADTFRSDIGERRGPINYDSVTVGAVFDTPVKGLRGYVNYATNARINFTTTTDIFNELLPIGKGVSKEAGLKFSMWNDRLSGNIAYYISEAKNFTGALGATRDMVDPDGINGRNGGNGYIYGIKSDGIDLALSARPFRPWQITVNYSEANGSERSNVVLPVFYNDEFNTTTSGGQQVVAVKGANGALSPLMVRSEPANAGSPLIPLSVGMMKDPNGSYFATLDPESGQISNAQQLGLLTAGVATNQTGLPIASHQLGFVPPGGGAVIVRKAGETTTGYPEHAFSLINRYQLSEGRFRGLVLGLSTIYQFGIRGYNYTDAAGSGTRRIFYYPDRFQNNVFATYNFKIGKHARATLQANVTNVFDVQKIVYLLSSANGTVRYAAYQYEPRKFSLTASLSF